MTGTLSLPTGETSGECCAARGAGSFASIFMFTATLNPKLK
jgi:hypothetical protein